MSSSPTAELWDAIAGEAAAESVLWQHALRPPAEREHAAVFSPLTEPRFALGLETIYEGYLVHYGRPRLFAPADADAALLLGDYLYAHGLVRVAAHEEVAAVADLSELISLCALLRGEALPGDGPLWAATAALLGRGALDASRGALLHDRDPEPLMRLACAAAGEEPVAAAQLAHARRV